VWGESNLAALRAVGSLHDPGGLETTAERAGPRDVDPAKSGFLFVSP
jgi:hypothetical protein